MYDFPCQMKFDVYDENPGNNHGKTSHAPPEQKQGK